jgi:hypothetical protein
MEISANRQRKNQLDSNPSHEELDPYQAWNDLCALEATLSLFADMAQSLSDRWNASPLAGEDGYPFDRSFDQVTVGIMAWKKRFERQIREEFRRLDRLVDEREWAGR